MKRILAPWCILLPFAAALAAAGEPAQYALRYDAASRTMQASLCLDRAAALQRFAGDASAPGHVEGLTRSSGASLQRDGDGWSARDWRAGECLRWRADLGQIADASARRSALHATGTITDPGGWLLWAADVAAADAIVELPAGIALSAPWTPEPSAGATRRYHIERTPPDWLARIAIGRMSETTIDRPGGRLHVAIGGTPDPAQRTRLLAWLERVSDAATTAYGRLPLADVQVLVIPVGAQRDAVVFGQSTRGEGNGLTLFVDPSRDAHAFERDWIAVHELSHLFHPHLGARGAWLAEGLATYLQNVLRARSGLLTPAQAWAELADGFARGRAATPRDAAPLEQASLDMERAHGYTRVYWSGTAYWLAVDLDLRHASGGRIGIDDALRRFDACCLAPPRAWSPQAFVERLDALMDTDVFARRWREYRTLTRFPDVPALDASTDTGVRAAIMRAKGGRQSED
ncbi:MAG: M61 family metallopeptidase [Dokdonella sp.]|uniref:M61 family metallopeptidase n=1 Tax=Dokdonella sp. TaxID=2291710 RepID=UPI003F7CD8EF